MKRNSNFTVELTLKKSGDMLPGMSASASVGLSTVESALCVPVAALGEGNSVTVLYTSYDKDSVLLGSPVTVTIGAADSEYVQIQDGISAGVAVSYPTTIPCAAAPDPRAVPCHSDIRLKQVREHSFTCFFKKCQLPFPMFLCSNMWDSLNRTSH